MQLVSAYRVASYAECSKCGRVFCSSAAPTEIELHSLPNENRRKDVSHYHKITVATGLLQNNVYQ